MKQNELYIEKLIHLIVGILEEVEIVALTNIQLNSAHNHCHNAALDTLLVTFFLFFFFF